ncbi:immunoglobulin superfamily member 22 [Clarias magur]|nr:immunoglobulin superfamily member 22 [Clarias magur]
MLQWDHTSDLDDDEHTHYIILKRDPSTPTWFTAAERIFSSKYTVTGLFPGQHSTLHRKPFPRAQHEVKPAFILQLKDHAV